MTKQVHRAATAMLASLTGIAGLLSATDAAALGVGPQAWAWVVTVLAAAIIVVTAARQAFETEAGP